VALPKINNNRGRKEKACGNFPQAVDG